MRKYVEHGAPYVDFMRKNPHHPVVQKLYPGSTLTQMLILWDAHDRILDILDRLPQTFCHQDAFRRNLFAHHDKTFAIDWGYAGIAPLGAELVPLIGATMAFNEIPANQAKQLEEVCFKGYLKGLQDAGWQSNLKQIRLGYAASLLLRYVIGSNIGELLPILLDENQHDFVEKALGRPVEEAAKNDPDAIHYYESVVLECLKLLGIRVISGVLLHAGGKIITGRL